MLVCPIDAERAAVHEYEYRRFADGLDSLQQLLLRRREIQARTIATCEPFRIHLHLLTFDVGGESCDHDHEIGPTCSLDCFVSRCVSFYQLGSTYIDHLRLRESRANAGEDRD